MSSVSVWPRVDVHQPMVKARCDCIDRPIGVVSSASYCARVSSIRWRTSTGTCGQWCGEMLLSLLRETSQPGPCGTEHPAVEFLRRLRPQDVQLCPPVGPRDSLTDVRRFPRVQFGAGVYGGGYQPGQFVFVERRGSFRGDKITSFPRHCSRHPTACPGGSCAMTPRSCRDRAPRGHPRFCASSAIVCTIWLLAFTHVAGRADAPFFRFRVLR